MGSVSSRPEKVLVSAPYFIPVIDRFREVFCDHGLEIVIPPVRERLEEDELIPWVGDIHGAICGDDRYTARVLAAAPKLRVISKWGTGIDSIDGEACRERGIVVCNTPGAFTDPVADSVMAYLLCAARKVLPMAESMRSGSWEKLPGVALRELTLGIIGVGNIGQAVSRRARAFGMRVLGCDPRRPPADFLEENRVEMVDRSHLLASADMISLNCDLNESTFHLIDAEALRLVKENAWIINTARGSIVDESALVARLAAKKLAGAALDVFETEPLPKSSPLRGMGNVILAAHAANASPCAWEFVHQKTIENLVEILSEGSLR